MAAAATERHRLLTEQQRSGQSLGRSRVSGGGVGGREGGRERRHSLESTDNNHNQNKVRFESSISACFQLTFGYVFG